jgi:hypothetical protein
VNGEGKNGYRGLVKEASRGQVLPRGLELHGFVVAAALLAYAFLHATTATNMVVVVCEQARTGQPAHTIVQMYGSTRGASHIEYCQYEGDETPHDKQI